MSSQLLVQHMLQGASMYRSMALGDASADAAAATRRSVLLLTLDGAFGAWKEKVLAYADSTDEGNAGTLRNLVASAARSFNRFIGGEVDQGDAMQRTMNATMDLIRQMGASNIPGLQDVYDNTAAALRSLLMSVASTAGEAAGTLIAAGAKAAGVTPSDVGAGIGKIALAVGLVGGAVVLTQAKSILGMFKGKRKNPRRRR